MPHFPSLPEDAGVRYILQFIPAAGRALVELRVALLRGDSPLSAKDTELIAAYSAELFVERGRALHDQGYAPLLAWLPGAESA